MPQAAPGQHFREGMSLVEAVKQFGDEEAAEQWFIEARWPSGIACPDCGSLAVNCITSRRPAPFRCTDCRRAFSIKTGTVMQGSNLPLGKWGLAMYLLTTNLKGVSSMKLHRDLGITQKAAWHLAHRIRKAWERPQGPFAGPVEVDETYVGGRKKRGVPGRGPVGKAPVAGVKDRVTKRVSATPVARPTRGILEEFIGERVDIRATVYTDDFPAYRRLPHRHETVRHSTGEYVRGRAHTNGIESFWSMLKRGYVGTYHQMSRKHLGRYVAEFTGRHNDRPADTVEQVRHLAQGMAGKRLRYRDLIAK